MSILNLVECDSNRSNTDAPQRTRAVFIEGLGSLWQTFTLPAGDYTFSFRAAQAVNVNDSSQQLDRRQMTHPFPGGRAGRPGRQLRTDAVSLLGLPTSTKTSGARQRDGVASKHLAFRAPCRYRNAFTMGPG